MHIGWLVLTNKERPLDCHSHFPDGEAWQSYLTAKQCPSDYYSSDGEAWQNYLTIRLSLKLSLFWWGELTALNLLYAKNQFKFLKHVDNDT